MDTINPFQISDSDQAAFTTAAILDAYLAFNPVSSTAKLLLGGCVSLLVAGAINGRQHEGVNPVALAAAQALDYGSDSPETSLLAFNQVFAKSLLEVYQTHPAVRLLSAAVWVYTTTPSPESKFLALHSVIGFTFFLESGLDVWEIDTAVQNLDEGDQKAAA
jgi:hypothetical protein